jgi:C-terminal processing protease CtpA/Prc
LREEKESKVAILTIKSLSAGLLQSQYQQACVQTFDSVFTQIGRDRIKNLILDLRDNQGGDFSPARTLLSYLVFHSSRFLLEGEEARIVQPALHHFKGRLFVLINGGSFSSTAMICACLKRDQRARFIGEETGGNPHVITGDPVKLVLPRTKIKAEISTTIYRITGGSNDGHGLMPDYPIHPTIAEIMAGKDPAKALAMKLISKI